jgi:hypothetical protein
MAHVILVLMSYSCTGEIIRNFRNSVPFYLLRLEAPIATTLEQSAVEISGYVSYRLEQTKLPDLAERC